MPNGQTATAAGGVLIIATEEGSASSGLSGTIELTDVLDFVSTVTLVGSTMERVGFDAAWAAAHPRTLFRLREEAAAWPAGGPLALRLDG